ncbi:hypothetical protein MJH12_14400 [bacterium]|nr:hypothetical protein [bacterium]
MSYQRFHFVYNVNSGFLNTGIDIAHKIISPSTYNCHLCQLTHSVLKERELFTKFRDDFPNKIVFYHKDESLPDCMKEGPFPSIWTESTTQFQLLSGPEEISQFENISDLLEYLSENMSLKSCKP